MRFSLFRRDSATKLESMREERNGALPPNDEHNAPDPADSPEAIGEPSLGYSPDAPLTDPKQDRFDREPFSRRIAETIARRRDPSSMVLAIYGPWGDGKTTVLNFIRSVLSEDPSVVCVDFNPWRLEGEDALLRGFFSTLAEAIDTQLENRAQKVGELLKRYSFILKPIPGASGFGEFASGAGELMSAVSLNGLRSQISSILRSAKKRVVILIDDIDRLERSEIQAVFRLVKLTADFDYVTYVLAFDESMVAAAIGERFSADPAAHRAAGTMFLEKIVQVGLHLPPAGSPEIRRFALEQVIEALRVSRTELKEKDRAEFGRNFHLCLALRIKTPRSATRYGNILQFSLGLLQGEVNAADLMMIEGIRTFYPQLYTAIRQKREFVLACPKNDSSTLEDFIRKSDPSVVEEEVRGVACALEALFPRTKKLHTYDQEWDVAWSFEKRLCSAQYFDRYFSYAVKGDDVSDLALEDLLNSETMGTSEYSSKMQSVLTPANAGTLITKLALRADSLSSSISRLICIGIASASDSLESLPNIDRFTAPVARAAMLISNLLKRVPPQDRLNTVKEMFEASELPIFLAECVTWMSASDEKTPGVLTAEETEEVRKLAGDLILKALEEEETPIFCYSPGDAVCLLDAIRSGLGAESVWGYVRKCLERRPENVLAFIRCFGGKATVEETGLPMEAPLFRQQYDSVIAFADEHFVAHLLEQLYPGRLIVPDLDVRADTSDLRLARQFIRIYSSSPRPTQDQTKDNNKPSPTDEDSMN